MAENRSSLEAALRGGAWAVTGVVLGIDHIRDVNGRPLGERRAPADSRRDVPIELVSCPYRDERRGGLMNRSALEPTMRQFAAVVAQVSGFHAALPAVAAPTWTRMLAVVLDQLAAPARYLLMERRSEGPVPAELAAAHKLAAGYFGALMALLRQQASGVAAVPEVSAAGFTRFVHERGSLIGASEVCAGPPHNIDVLTRLFVEGASTPPPRDVQVTAARVQLAQLLAAQVRLGLAWEVFDEVIERGLLLEAFVGGALQARTQYLLDRIATRVEELRSRTAPDPTGLARYLPESLEDPELAAGLAAPVAELASPAQVHVILDVLKQGDSAVVLDEANRIAYALRFANLLCRYRLFVQAQWRLEQLVRGVLGYPQEAGFELNALLCPRPRALEWFDVFTGHRLQWVAGPRTELEVRNHRRVVPFA